jgi:heavy metal efflux system protein
MIAIVILGRIDEKESRIVRWMKTLYEPALKRAIRTPAAFIGGAMVVVIVAGLLATQLGQEFIPTLDEKNIAMHSMRIPSTSLSQSQAMQLTIEERLTTLPQVGLAFSKSGTADIATDPLPPNLSNTFIMLKPREEWPNPDLTKGELQQQIKATLVV